MKLIPWKGHSRPSGAATEHPLASFRSEMDRLFDRFFGDAWGLPGFFGSGLVEPRLDLSETDTEVVLRAELPGVKSEDVRIEVVGNTLTLSGEKNEETSETRGGYRYRERQFGAFSRTIPLPTYVDSNKVDATYKDGVLTIRLGKSPESKPKRITVRNA